MESRPEAISSPFAYGDSHMYPAAVQNVCLPVFLAYHLKSENLPKSCFLMSPGSLLDATARMTASRRICLGV